MLIITNATGDDVIADGERETSTTSGGATKQLHWDDAVGTVPEVTAVGTSTGSVSERMTYGPLGIQNVGGNFYGHSPITGNADTTFDPVNPSGYVGTQNYTAWGEAIGASDPSFAFGYTGEYQPTDNASLHLRAREYDPSLGIFTSRDPMQYGPGVSSQDSDPYSYTGGRPMYATDPSGMATAIAPSGSVSLPTVNAGADGATDVGAAGAGGALVGGVEGCAFVAKFMDRTCYGVAIDNGDGGAADQNQEHRDCVNGKVPEVYQAWCTLLRASTNTSSNSNYCGSTSIRLNDSIGVNCITSTALDGSNVNMSQRGRGNIRATPTDYDQGELEKADRNEPHDEAAANRARFIRKANAKADGQRRSRHGRGGSSR